MTPRAGYCQARAQARFGTLPGEAVWRHLEPVRDLGGYLAEARGTALEPWVSGINPDTDAAEIERILSRRLAGLLDECAAWLGPPWGAAMEWLRWLPRLPELEARLREELPPVGDPAPLLALRERHGTLLAGWRAGWQQRLPRMGRREAESLAATVDAIARHVEAFPHLDVREAWPERHALEQRLRARFRAATLHVAAVFCLLALTALLIERLRAALLARALFAPPGATEG